MVDNTSQIARLSNRVLMAAKNEAENSEDPGFVGKINSAADNLQRGDVRLLSVTDVLRLYKIHPSAPVVCSSKLATNAIF